MKLTSSPRLEYLLHEMGILSYEDVLSHLPRRYESFFYSTPKELEHLEDKQKIVLYGKLVGEAKFLRFRNMSNCKFFFRSELGEEYQVVAWNRPYLRKMLNQEDAFTLQASYSKKNHELNLLSLKKGRIEEKAALKPIYSLPKEFPPHSFEMLVDKALKALDGMIGDELPSYFVKKYRLKSHFDALRLSHQPESFEDIRQGQRVLKYEEALSFCLKNAIVRDQNKALCKNRIQPIKMEKVESFIDALPYKLTGDQRKAIDECMSDMDKRSLMYRLLQGDVGSGKTLVAELLMYANYTRGYQSAMMAPTDALARQHYENVKRLFEGKKMTITLLLGSLSKEERASALSDIADGTSDIIIGTHALFAKSVNYANLGLVIIDEQHKFGVNQRTLLASKGDHADLLLMSATPIPRTLSMSIYGDLDVSTLNEFPSKQKQIKTIMLPPKSKQIQKYIETTISEGRQVYIVAPRIDSLDPSKPSAESVKDVFDIYDKRYPGKVVLLHGQMKQEDKDAAMASFACGLYPIIVSTSLIEVGLDVKKAGLMIIYEPSHFALSSLHQLRGRIGRDGTPSTCILAYGGDEEDDLDKLGVLIRSLDGFEIAEEDLRRRGPGEIAGSRQSGLPDLRYVNIVNDFRMFEAARDDAQLILANSTLSEFAEAIAKAKKNELALLSA